MLVSHISFFPFQALGNGAATLRSSSILVHLMGPGTRILTLEIDAVIGRDCGVGSDLSLHHYYDARVYVTLNSYKTIGTTQNALYDLRKLLKRGRASGPCTPQLATS